MSNLINQNQLFDDLEETIPGVIYKFILDDELNIKFIYISKSVQRIFGINPKLIINSIKNDFDYIHKDDTDTFLSSIKKSIENLSNWEWKGRLVVNNTIKYVSTKATPNLKDKTNIVWTGFVFDITDCKNYDLKLKLSTQKIIETQKMSKTGIWEIYSSTKKVLWTEELYKIYEISKDAEITFELFLKSVHPDDIERIKSLLTNPPKENYVSFEYRIIFSDGRIKYLYNTFKVENKENEPFKYWGIAQDITETKLNENKIINNQNRLECLVNSIDDVVIEIDEDFTITNVWITDEKELPIPKEQMINKNVDEIYDPNFASRIKENLKAVFESGKSRNFEYDLIIHNVNRWFSSKLSLIDDSDPTEKKRVIATIRDVTDYKLKEEELLRAKELAELATEAKSQFLSVMSHELRTPINAVIGVSHLMLQNDPREDQMENLKALRFSSENLLVIINDILDFSKIEAGKIEFEQVKFSIKELVNNIRFSFLQKESLNNIDIDVEISEDVPDLLIGDPTRTYQIISNLVSNSVKFTEKGFIKISISLNAFIGNFISINVTIEDSGIGIDESKINNIFESFTQADSSTNRKFGGTGLGLTITKKLLELQGSEIKVISEVGKGTKFFFRLNFKKYNQDEKLEQNNSDVNTLIENKSLKGMKVLLVEDNKINTMIALQFLKKWSVVTDTAENGLIAIEKVKQNDYDLILMDLQMPEMNGYESSKKIREMGNEKYKKIIIIALTASATNDIKEKTYEAGMNDFMSKPFKPDELQKKLRLYYK